MYVIRVIGGRLSLCKVIYLCRRGWDDFWRNGTSQAFRSIEHKFNVSSTQPKVDRARGRALGRGQGKGRG